jgi:hypothetical protein
MVVLVVGDALDLSLVRLVWEGAEAILGSFGRR